MTKRGNLNMKQLLNLIFFSPDRRHPDMKRQRTRKVRSKMLRALRREKRHD